MITPYDKPPPERFLRDFRRYVRNRLASSTAPNDDEQLAFNFYIPTKVINSDDKSDDAVEKDHEQRR